VTASSSPTATASLCWRRAACSTWDAPPATPPLSCPAPSPTRCVCAVCGCHGAPGGGGGEAQCC
jgi:hypothetical protein